MTPIKVDEVVKKTVELAHGQLSFEKLNKEGTGLGLYITHLIVLAHRGEIRCESQIGKGTKFIIEVPVYEGKMTPPKILLDKDKSYDVTCL